MWKFYNVIIKRHRAGSQLSFVRNLSVGGVLSQQVNYLQKEQELEKSETLFTNNY